MSLNEVTGFFCYLVVLLLFACSAVSKWRDPTAYQRSIEGFALLPASLIPAMSWLAIWAESLLVVLLLAGLRWHGLQLFALLLALLLLLVFTGALISVIARGLHVSCGCFGTNEHPVSVTSLVRNSGLMVFCVVSLLTTFTLAAVGQPPVVDLLVLALAAVAFVLLWSNLDEVTTVLSPKAVGNSR